eukprot:scaffold57895_cov62-Phaeocystis_antarctica.AAC.4
MVAGAVAAAYLAGSQRQILAHLWPSSATLCTMISSSARVHDVRSFFSGINNSARTLPPSPTSRPSCTKRPPVRGTAKLAAPFGLSGCCSGPRINSCSRLHRLRTASSDLPGSCAAIARHLQPSR